MVAESKVKEDRLKKIAEAQLKAFEAPAAEAAEEAPAAE